MTDLASFSALSASIDWLEFSVHDLPYTTVIEDVLHLGAGDFTLLAGGRFGYQKQIKWADGNVFILFNDQDTPQAQSMGVHVMITGKGCRAYSQVHDLKALLVELTARKPAAVFTRVDLAIDDMADRLVNFDRIHDAAIAGHFTSRWSKWDELNSRQCTTGEFRGRTMYFGSQSSAIFCRIYDKTLERKAKSKEEKPVADHWTRLEVVFKKERAQQLVGHLVGGMPVGVAIRGVLKQYIRFLVPSDRDTNKARWASAPWWDHLLAGVESLSLTFKPETRSIEEMASWVEKQISPTIAAIMTAHQGDLAWLEGAIAKGAVRMSRRHHDAISNYLKEAQ